MSTLISSPSKIKKKESIRKWTPLVPPYKLTPRNDSMCLSRPKVKNRTRKSQAVGAPANSSSSTSRLPCSLRRKQMVTLARLSCCICCILLILSTSLISSSNGSRTTLNSESSFTLCSTSEDCFACSLKAGSHLQVLSVCKQPSGLSKGP